MDGALNDLPNHNGPFIVPFGMPHQHGLDKSGVRALVDLAAAVRDMQNALASSFPTAEESREMAIRLREMTNILAGRRVEEQDRVVGRIWNVPGKAQYLAPPYQWSEVSDDRCRGTVQFGQMYLGAGAIHGGALPLVYDEIMGSLANRTAPARCRTVNLCVRYRALTPVDTPIDLEVRLDREEGRKRFLTARMMADGTLLSEAEGIFVVLLPGQR